MDVRVGLRTFLLTWLKYIENRTALELDPNTDYALQSVLYRLPVRYSPLIQFGVSTTTDTSRLFSRVDTRKSCLFLSVGIY